MNYEEMLKQAKKTGKVYEGIALAKNIQKNNYKKFYVENKRKNQQN